MCAKAPGATTALRSRSEERLRVRQAREVGQAHGQKAERKQVQGTDQREGINMQC
jgi:hypothetical protein